MNKRKKDIYKSRRKKLKLTAYLLGFINLLLLAYMTVFEIIKIKISNSQIILIIIFWLVSLVVIDLNIKINND